MVQKSKLLAQTGEIILLNAENMLPKYFVIYNIWKVRIAH